MDGWFQLVAHHIRCCEEYFISEKKQEKHGLIDFQKRDERV